MRLLGKYAFFVCTCLTFTAMGLFRSVYEPLAMAAVSGAVYLIMAWRQAGYPAVPRAALLPFALAAYIAVFPGWASFPDIQLADILLEMYIVGVGITVFFPKRAYVPALCLTACIAAVFTYWLFASPPSFVFGGYRLQLLFNHPNVLGLMSSWCILYIFCFWRQLPRVIMPFAIMGILCLLIAIFLTDGRSTYLSILLAITGCCFIMPWKMFRKVLFAGILCWICGYAALLSSGYSRPLPAVEEMLQEQHIGNRMVFWKAALDGFFSAPLTGLGHRTYGAYLDRYISQNCNTVKERPHYPHNMYLDILYSWGLAGGALLIATFIPAILDARRRQDYFLPLSVLLMLGHGIFDSSLHMKAGLMVLFVPLGMQWGKHARASFTVPG